MVADSVGAPDEDVQSMTHEGFTNISYTRAGNFYMDANGYLVNVRWEIFSWLCNAEYLVRR